MAVTAYSSPENSQEAMSAGFDLFRAKPITPEAVIAAVVEALQPGRREGDGRTAAADLSAPRLAHDAATLVDRLPLAARVYSTPSICSTCATSRSFASMKATLSAATPGGTNRIAPDLTKPWARRAPIRTIANVA